MKRELKVLASITSIVGTLTGHKAYPDEKGTESIYIINVIRRHTMSHKAYPDEKGTER